MGNIVSSDNFRHKDNARIEYRANYDPDDRLEYLTIMAAERKVHIQKDELEQIIDVLTELLLQEERKDAES